MTPVSKSVSKRKAFDVARAPALDQTVQGQPEPAASPGDFLSSGASGIA